LCGISSLSLPAILIVASFQAPPDFRGAFFILAPNSAGDNHG